MTDSNITPIKPPIVVLRERLQERRGELKAALTDIDPDHFIRALITAAQINPELQACSFQSLWLACMHACRDNLLPDGREAAIVPFKSSATYIAMYQGLLKKFRASGQCKWIGADVHRKGEIFEHWIDQTGEHFKHVPGDDEQAAIDKVYAAALTKDGAFYVAVLSIGEINKIKATSKASREDSPWSKWPSEMMKKTALRRLAKLLPSGRDIMEEDDDTMFDEPAPSPIAMERSPGAASALAQFAGEPAPVASEGAPDALLTDHFVIAYERGQIARETGAQRRAVPGEYRNDNAAQELTAWLAGYDGKPFMNPETGETLGPNNAEG